MFNLITPGNSIDFYNNFSLLNLFFSYALVKKIKLNLLQKSQNQVGKKPVY